MEQDQENFEDVRTRLEQIVDEVNAEDISLDDALKLYEEAVKLGLSACELSEKDIFPQEEPVEEVAEGEPGEPGEPGDVPLVRDEPRTRGTSPGSPFEASDIAEAAAIQHMGDAASVQFSETVESAETAEVEDDGQATYPR